MIWDTVVVGAGIGGLACAGALAAQGRRVAVLEQAEAPGGYLVTFTRNGFRFDAAVDCIAGLDEEGLFTWLLRGLGVQAAVKPLRLDPIHISRFPGLTVPVDGSVAAYAERLGRLFPAERAGLAAFFARAEAIYADIEAMRLALQAGQGAGARLPRAWIRYAPLTYAELLALDIRDPRLQAILSDRCPFLGASPRQVSATRMVALMMSYFRSGAFRIAGGHQRLPEALADGIRRCGGVLHTGCPARRIVVEDGRCTRVLTEDGADFPTRHVVAAGDFHETFGRLLAGEVGERVLAQHAATPVSPSFFIGYTGVRREAPPDASSIGSFPTFDLPGLLERYTPFADTEALGLAISTVEDPGMAPPACDVVVIHELIPPGWAEAGGLDKEARLAQLIRKADRVLPGLRRGLVHSEAATPASLARHTRNHGGAAYGWSQGPRFVRIRHGLANLHLAGHWAEMGGGVLPAAMSGIRAAVAILRATE